MNEYMDEYGRENYREQVPREGYQQNSEAGSRNVGLIVTLSVLAVLAFAFSVSLILMHNGETAQGETAGALSRKEQKKFDYVSWARNNSEYPTLESPPETPSEASAEIANDSPVDSRTRETGFGTYPIAKMSPTDPTRTGTESPSSQRQILVRLQPDSRLLNGMEKSDKISTFKSTDSPSPTDYSPPSASIESPQTLTASGTVAPGEHSSGIRRVVSSSGTTKITPATREIRENAYWIQVIAAGKLSIVEDVREKINKLGFSAQIQVLNKEDEDIYRVRIGAYDNKTEAEKYADFLRKIEGMEDSYVAIAPVTRRIATMN